jgi:hypothetical protein
METGELKEIELRPGLVKNMTPYEAGQSWIEGDKVRWRDGRVFSIGGWVSFSSNNDISGTPRALHTWSALDGQNYVAVGTNEDFYVFSSGSFTSIVDTTTDVPAGLVNNAVVSGYGAGTYGSGGYGSPNNGSVTLKLRQWSVDNFGEDLIINPEGRGIFYWDLSVGGDASVITDAPAECNFMFIHEPAPFVFALGCTNESDVFDPMLVRWSDDADYTDWTPATDNNAGRQRLQGGSKLIGALKTRLQTIIWSDTTAYAMELTGGDFVFGFNRIGSKCGLIAPHAAQEVEGTVYWMGINSFYQYDGVVTPIRTPLDLDVFGEPEKSNVSPNTINRGQKEKVYCGVNSQHNELWWFYPSLNSVENDRYVIYNYREKTWYSGSLERTVWEDSSIFEKPIAGKDGQLFEHEIGSDDDGAPMNASLTSGIFGLDTGTEILFNDRYVPDLNIEGTMTITLKGKKYPNSNEEIVKGPFIFDGSTETVDYKLRGRTMQIVLSQNELGGSFDLGVSRFRISPDGFR